MTRRISFEEYQKIQAANWSTLKELRRSPLHYQHQLKEQRPDTPALALGRAVHCAVFEPDELPLRYSVYTESKSRGDGARKRWEEFRAANASRTILSSDDWRTVCAIRDAVRKDPLAARLLRTGDAERTLQWSDGETGLRCKARLDWIGPDGIADLKTTRTPEPRRFAAQAASLGYHGQLAFYRRGVKATTGVDGPVRLIVVESEPPHDVIVYAPDDDWLDEGDALVSDLLSEVAARRISGCWPGIARGEELPLSLPRWALPSGDEEADGLGLSFGGAP